MLQTGVSPGIDPGIDELSLFQSGRLIITLVLPELKLRIPENYPDLDPAIVWRDRFPWPFRSDLFKPPYETEFPENNPNLLK